MVVIPETIVRGSDLYSMSYLYEYLSFNAISET
jgi:hypothetical protein